MHGARQPAAAMNAGAGTAQPRLSDGGPAAITILRAIHDVMSLLNVAR